MRHVSGTERSAACGAERSAREDAAGTAAAAVAASRVPPVQYELDAEVAKVAELECCQAQFETQCGGEA